MSDREASFVALSAERRYEEKKIGSNDEFCLHVTLFFFSFFFSFGLFLEGRGGNAAATMLAAFTGFHFLHISLVYSTP